MERKSYFKSRTFIFLILGIISMLIISRWNSDIRGDYKFISDIGEFTYTVDVFSEYVGGVYLDFDIDEKIYIPSSCNESLKPKCLSNFLRRGDVIKKKEGSKYIVIYREGVRYVFKLGEIYYSNPPCFRDCDDEW